MHFQHHLKILLLADSASYMVSVSLTFLFQAQAESAAAPRQIVCSWTRRRRRRMRMRRLTRMRWMRRGTRERRRGLRVSKPLEVTNGAL